MSHHSELRYRSSIGTLLIQIQVINEEFLHPPSNPLLTLYLTHPLPNPPSSQPILHPNHPLPQPFSTPPPPGMPDETVPSAPSRPPQLLNGSSFQGCIRNLYINQELQDFTRGRMRPGVVPGCHACRKLLCLHGFCQPHGAQVWDKGEGGYQPLWGLVDNQ